MFGKVDKKKTLQNIGYVMTGLMESVGASRKVFELMSRRPGIAHTGQERPQLSGAVALRDVRFTYPSRPQNPVLKVLFLAAMLQDLSLEVPAGETVALVGPSGGGKSSIVALLEHFYEPQEGEVLLDGVDISVIDHKYYHQKVFSS